MSHIENTSKTHGILDLPVFGGSSSAIERMERDGQRQLVNSDRLPTDTRGTDADFLAVGFTFGEPDPADPLFRPATLPPGWTRQGTDHAMHSEIVDTLGRKRVSVFYKAAFYDRRADMRLETPHSYLNSALYCGTDPVLDDEWLTPAVVDETLADIRDRYLKEASEFDGYAADGGRTEENRADLREIADKRRAEADKAEALRVKVAGAR